MINHPILSSNSSHDFLDSETKNFDEEICLKLIQNSLNIEFRGETRRAIDRGIAVLGSKRSVLKNIGDDARAIWSAETSENRWISFFQTIGKILVIVGRFFSCQSMHLKEYKLHKKLIKDISNYTSVVYYLDQKKLTAQQCLQKELIKIKQVTPGERMLVQTRVQELIHLIAKIKKASDHILEELETKKPLDETIRFDLCLAFLYQMITSIQKMKTGDQTSGKVEKPLHLDWLTQSAQFIFGILQKACPLIDGGETIETSSQEIGIDGLQRETIQNQIDTDSKTIGTDSLKSIKHRNILKATRIADEMHPAEEDVIPTHVLQAVMTQVCTDISRR